MFQLYKKRDFSAIMSDTFSFFKIYGKEYFRGYLIINGFLLILLILLIYFFASFFIESVFVNIGNPTGVNDAIMNYFQQNQMQFIFFGFLMVIIIIALSLISYMYPIGFLKAIEENKPLNNQTYLNFFKQNVSKSVLFLIFSIFIIIPIIAVLMLLTFALIFLIIGFPLLFVLMPALMCFVTLSYFEYITTNNSYFNSLGNAYKLLQKNFWAFIGATLITYIIIYIISTVFSIIPYSLGIASLYSGTNVTPNVEDLSFFSIMIMLFVVISIISSYILQNLFLINQGIIFYSAKEQTNNNSNLSAIDQIGKIDEE